MVYLWSWVRSDLAIYNIPKLYEKRNQKFNLLELGLILIENTINEGRNLQFE